MSRPVLLFVEVSSTGKVHDKKARHAIQNMSCEAQPRKDDVNPNSSERRNKAARRWSRYPSKPKPLFADECPQVHVFIPSPSLCPAMGGGRMDPFEQYPIEMDLEKLFLIDYGLCYFHV